MRWVALAALTLLLPGCTSDAGPNFTVREEYDGLAVSAVVAPEGDAWHLTADATNIGSKSIPYFTGCNIEWTWSLRGPDGLPVALPSESCADFRETELTPGAAAMFDYMWDGMQMDSTGAMVPAPAGEYTFRAAFQYGGHSEQASTTFVIA